MKKLRFLSLVLIIFILGGIIAACSKTDTQSPQPSQPSASKEPASETPTEGADESPDTEPGEIKMPLVDERIEFSVWIPGAPAATTRLKHEDDNIAIQAVEQLTNVHINRIRPGGTDGQEQFNLSVVSGDLPDSYITNPNFYIGGFDMYIEDEIIIDLSDYIDFFPNYQRIRMTNDDTRRRTITDTGKIPGLFEIKKTVQPSFVGLVTRGDLLDSLGVSKPETFEEYRELLIKFRDLGMKTPLLISNTGLEDGFMAGYGVGWSNYNGFFQEDGQVKFAPLEEGFKDYLMMMNQWYEERLIDQDFAGFVSSPFDYSPYASGEAGIWSTLYTVFTPIELAAAEVEGFRITTLTAPVKSKGDTRKLTIYNQSNTLISDGIETITTACENVEILLKYYDFFFTEEGSRYCDYGVEGVTYTMVDGKPVFTDLVMNDTEGYGSIYAIWGDYTYTGPKRLYDWERELLPTMSDETLNAGSVWDANFTGEYVLPDVSVSIEDSAEYSQIVSDATTFISETAPKFILGTIPFSEYDSFIQTLKDMRIDVAIAIKQAAFDRYMAR